MEQEQFGFILTRHVVSHETNLLWTECYRQIRKFYPKTMVMIVDDGSKPEYIVPIFLNNCFVINSEFVGRGELLAYYYFYKYPLFQKAIVLHDSVFINQWINFESIMDVRFLWCFTHEFDNVELETNFIRKLNNPQSLLDFYYTKSLWLGCFGGMSVIDHSFLYTLQQKHNLFVLLNDIQSRNERYHIERIIGLLCCYELYSMGKLYRNPVSLFGVIHTYGYGWGYSFDQYCRDGERGVIEHLPIIKVWSGR